MGEVTFRRIRGRIVPIKRKKDDVSVGGAAAVGAGVGVSYNVAKEVKGNIIDKSVSNSRGLKTFKSKLKAGDILVLGSTSKNSGGIEFGEAVKRLPKAIQKPILKAGKKVGIKKSTTLLSNSTLLTGLGGGTKYHAGVWDGKKVIHMSTDGGAVRESLTDAVFKQNVSALRFKNAGKREVESALKFAQGAVKSKTQYQGFSEYAMNGVSSLLIPFGKKASRCKGPLVCHTLPIRAYAKRKFSFRGEYTFSGDFKHAEDLMTVARRDLIKSPLLTAKGFGGAALKGLKYAAPAAAVAWGINKIRGEK